MGLLVLALGMTLEAWAQSLGPQAIEAVGLGRLWGQSVEAERRKDYETALAKVAEFGGRGGDVYLAALRTGWLFNCKQDYVRSAEAYRKAADCATNSLSPLQGLLSCQERLADFTGMVQTAVTILRVDPANFKANMAVGRAWFEKKQYARAQPYVQQASQLYPEESEAASYLAWTLFYLGKKADAAPVFRHLVTLQPDYPHAVLGLSLSTGSSKATEVQAPDQRRR